MEKGGNPYSYPTLRTPLKTGSLNNASLAITTLIHMERLFLSSFLRSFCKEKGAFQKFIYPLKAEAATFWGFT